MNTPNIRRQGQSFREGFDEQTGVRQTRVGNNKKVHQPLIDNMIVEFALPAKFIAREVPAKGDKPAIPYQEFRAHVNGGYVLINSFLGEDAAGTTVKVKAKIGEKTIRNGKETFQVYYLKFEDAGDQAVTHTLAIATHQAAVDTAMKVRTNRVFDLSHLTNMDGAIIVSSI